MIMIQKEISRIFNEFLLLLNENLMTLFVKFKKYEEPKISVNILFVSAIMKSAFREKITIAFAREKECSFIFEAS